MLSRLPILFDVDVCFTIAGSRALIPLCLLPVSAGFAKKPCTLFPVCNEHGDVASTSLIDNYIDQA
jgi:hypothetical protein